MVRNYQRKTNRANLNENDVKKAIRAVLTKKMSERKAAAHYNIKRDTLHSRVKKQREKNPTEEPLRTYRDSGNDSTEDEGQKEDESIFSSKYSTSQVFTTEQENHLVTYIKICSDMNYGLTYKQIRTLAYDYASILPNCKFPERWQTDKKAGLEWLKGFMQRNKDTLSLRKPESTSLARATGFNKRVVAEFFENYIRVVKKYSLKPEQIFNIDETGVTTVLKPVKVVSAKGKRQVSLASSAERGELTTFVGIINAVGVALPPVYVFPRKRNIDEYLSNAPTSSLALGNQSGWMTGELFPQVLQHVQKHTNCSNENKILILLDNHESHTTLKAINYCRDNGIIMLSFPPHTSHKLQPLDVGVFGPFKSYCSVSFNDWMTTNPGKVISVRQIPSLTKSAFHSAFTQKNITHSFEKPGLWPINRLAFTDEDFTASFVNIIRDDETSVEASTSTENQHSTQRVSTNPGPSSTNTDTIRASTPLLNTTPPGTPPHSTNENALSTSPLNISVRSLPRQSTAALTLTPDAVRPFPRPTIRKKKDGKNRTGKSRIYTDTPEKDRLEELNREKERRKKVQDERKQRKLMKHLFPAEKKSRKEPKPKRIKRLPHVSSSDSDESWVESQESDDVEENNIEVSLDDYVIVSYERKCYPGIVTKIEDDSVTISHMTKCGKVDAWKWPEKLDVLEYKQNEIIKIIPPPVLLNKRGFYSVSAMKKFE